MPLLTPAQAWAFLPHGYLFSILIETPVLLLGLSHRHSIGRRLFAGVWLTACTYPIVILVLPLLFPQDQRGLYLLVAETFAPVAECAIFWAMFGSKEPNGRVPQWGQEHSNRSKWMMEHKEEGIKSEDTEISAANLPQGIKPPSDFTVTTAPTPSSTPSGESLSPDEWPDAPPRESRWAFWQDMLTITLANLASFALGEVWPLDWWPQNQAH
jgi:hypothetical protein